MTPEELFKIIERQGLRLLAGIVVMVIGFWIVHRLVGLIERDRKHVPIEATLKGFLDNFAKILLYILVVVVSARVMGFPMTSFITLLASVGVAVSLAMQGALSNFIGGVTMLLLKPIKNGEYIKVGDTEGTVKNIGMFYTDIVTPDNRLISQPNNSLTDTAIINYSREGTRRLDVVFSVSYSADLDEVSNVLMDVVRRSEAVLPEPAPEVHLSECANSSLNFTVRFWCKCSDYWKAYYFMLDEGKRALDRAGIEIPYPQMDVHVK